ncbi:hypothetical protein N3K66_007907 [Trichothecium roseum]|uniref:Uncharacterized protein n=1 Tax=Trichothecium roseum TaxID=47278 RepID=A0ACC0URY1_9HYPO|nr:hypothetical protein N3K66_007907 [Trichothecium roseum]
MNSDEHLELDRPCQHCKVLFINDAEQGGAIKLTKQGVRYVDFGRNRSSPRSNHAGVSVDSPKTELKLDYEREDSLPHMPDFLQTATDGCSFCSLLRDDIGRAWLSRKADLERQQNGFIEIVSADLMVAGISYRFDEDVSSRWGLEELTETNIGLTSMHVYFAIRWENGEVEYSLTYDVYADAADFWGNEEPQGGHRMALSYCWGSEKQAEQQLKTTSSSLRRHLNRIIISKLPKTVADAVQLCKALGIRYLWVDALCIIQDDKDDWAQEASEMANVYSNSHVTLCILRGSSCLEGFLESKYAPRTLGVKFSSALDPAVTGKLYLRMLRPPEETIDVVSLALKGTPSQRAQVPGHLDFENSVWQTRAWTFQEARLSPRKLYVGENMFHMSCGSVRESADGSGFFDGLGSMDAHDDASFDQQHQHQHQQHHMQQWYGLVSDYAKRNLTYEKDRFPAFAAIARTFSDQFPGEEYVAGLWKSDLHRGLLWTPGSSTTFEDHFRLPDHGYVAPSWSWARRRHSVAWVQGKDDDKSVFVPECRWLDIGIAHASMNTFGSITSAHIQMSARAMQLFPPAAGRKLSRAPDEEVVYLGFGFYFTIKSGAGEYMADLHLDWLLLGCERGKYPDGPIDELWMVLVASSTLEVRDSGWAPRVSDK